MTWKIKLWNQMKDLWKRYGNTRVNIKNTQKQPTII